MFKPVRLLVIVNFAAMAAAPSLRAERSAPLVYASGPQCFRVTEVSGYRLAGGGFVNVRADGNRWFQMRLSGNCPEFGRMMKVGIRPIESSWLCEGKADELIVDTDAGTGKCYVSDISRLNPADIPPTS